MGSIPTQVRDFSLSFGDAQKVVPDAVDHPSITFAVAYDLMHVISVAFTYT